MAKKKSKKKPAGWRNFDRLARKIVRVPKEEMDAQIEEGREERKRNRDKAD